ncbi:MAG: family 10 glycosylhydrolase [Kiritimatiellae bacterium]|nr:family 10 glycosylhydrolase [Kiritimatiellia bacterium]
MSRNSGCFTGKWQTAAIPLLLFVLAAGAVDVREKHIFKGPFDMHVASGVSFAFTCDKPREVQRRYVYFKSGDGCYVVPFSVKSAGRSVIAVSRNACVREEGRVAGWGNIQEIMVSFWREDTSPVNWSASDVALRTEPYVAVVSVPGSCVHDYPKRLEACGLSTLLVGAAELDDQVLASAKLLVPIWGKKPYPESAQKAMKRFTARGGRVFPVKERLAANTHRKLLLALSARCPDMKDVFDRKLVELEMQAKRAAEVAAGFPAFMRAGGEDEIRGMSCHTAYGPEGVQNDPKWENWDRNCRLLKAAGFNAVNVNVARGGIAFYESKVLPMSPEVATKGDSVELIKKACDKYGMKFIAWKVCFRSRVGMKTPAFEKWIAEGRGAVSYGGDRNDEWLCPTRPENRALEIESLVELAKRRPWAISLDYIRYHGTDWCFCEHCRKEFEAFSGETVADWPKGVRKRKALEEKWEAFRRHTITSLVREVARRVRAEAPGVKIRADLIGRARGSALSVGQEWNAWCREGLLDIAGPMDGGDADTLKDRLPRQIADVGDARRMLPTYYPSMLPSGANAADLEDIIRVGREAGIMGFSLFRFDGRLIEMLALEKGETKGERK